MVGKASGVGQAKRMRVSTLHGKRQDPAWRQSTRGQSNHLAKISEVDERVARANHVEESNRLVSKIGCHFGRVQRCVRAECARPFDHFWRQVHAHQVRSPGP